MADAQKKSPGKTLFGILMLLPAIAFGVLLGVLLVSYADRLDGGSKTLGFTLIIWGMLCLYLGMLLHIILHEAGHLLAGLKSGYGFVSFNILGIIWTRGADGKIHRGRSSIAGAAGQCLMSPPPYEEGQFPFTLYNLGGVLMNLLVSAVCLPLALLCAEMPFLFLFLMMTSLVGLALAAMNGLPLPVAALQNDGKNLLCIRQDEIARRAFWSQMFLAAQMAEGKRLRDLPDKLFTGWPKDSVNPIVTSMMVFESSRRMDALDFSGAEAAIRALLARPEGILGLHRTALTCDGATCECLAARPGELTATLGEKEHQQILKAMKANPSFLRTQYALALLRDRDQEKAARLLDAFDAAAKKHPLPQEIDSEREILAAIQEAAASRSR